LVGSDGNATNCKKPGMGGVPAGAPV